MSWILAVTVTPYLGKPLLKAPRDTSKDPYRGLVYSAYRGFLWMALRARVLVVLTVVGITVWSVMAFGQVKQAFFPASNTPIFYVEFQMPQGTDIRATNEEMARLEAIILGEEIVTDVTTLVGRAASRFMLTYEPELPNPAYGQLIVRVSERDLIDELIVELRHELPKHFPDVEIYPQRLMFGPGGGAKIEARFKGSDPAVLRQLGMKAALGLHVSAELQQRTDRETARAYADAVARRAPTLVKDVQGLLPLDPAKQRRVLVFSGGIVFPFLPEPLPFVLPELLAEKGFEVTLHEPGMEVSAERFDLVLICSETRRC